MARLDVTGGAEVLVSLQRDSRGEDHAGTLDARDAAAVLAHSGKITHVALQEDGTTTLSAAAALALYAAITDGGIRCWVMGGWGVDALVAEETRPHHDLDLLVRVEDFPAFLDLLVGHGFSRKLVWEEENRWIDVHGEQRPTAFVMVDGVGRELDVHVIEVPEDGEPTALCDVSWQFDRSSLTAVGRIAGFQVRCVSAETQLQMHTGYDLPVEHQADVEQLSRLIRLAR